MRPKSIIQFEQVYIAMIVVGLISTALNWNTAVAQLAANPMTAQFGPGFLIGSAVVGLVVNLLLLYYVARKASVVAKWIVVVFTVVGVLFALPGLFSNVLPPLVGILTVVSIVLSVIAACLLFRPDANAWFADGRG